MAITSTASTRRPDALAGADVTVVSMYDFQDPDGTDGILLQAPAGV